MARARSLKEFQTSFSDETSCAAFLFERRWPEGFVCPSCGDRRAALLRSRAHTYECLDCGRQTPITAGTGVRSKSVPKPDSLIKAATRKGDVKVMAAPLGIRSQALHKMSPSAML
jgi:predicted RNA-binding Zn-ribbon protein involved in translation (DUF1610 family)